MAFDLAQPFATVVAANGQVFRLQNDILYKNFPPFAQVNDLPAVGTTAADHARAVGFGQVEGHRRIAVLGNVTDIDTLTVPEDVWPSGGVYPWIPSARALRVRSSSPEDSPTGTGVASISFQPLDASYAEASPTNPSVTAALNGTTPVAVAGTWLRINDGVIASKGSNAPAFATNVGDIFIEDADAPNTVRTIIPAGTGFARQSQFTVPLGWRLSVESQVFCINRSQPNRDLTVSTYVQTSSGLYRLPLELSVVGGQVYRHDGLPGVVLPEKTDFGYRVVYCSNDNTNFTAGFLATLKKNDRS